MGVWGEAVLHSEESLGQLVGGQALYSGEVMVLQG